MVQKSWHKRIIEAIRRLAEEKKFEERGFENLRSYRVKIEDELEYKPDAIWARKWGDNYDVVIGEVEKTGSGKCVAGAAALTSRCLDPSTSFYNFIFGRGQRKKREDIARYLCYFKGNEISTCLAPQKETRFSLLFARISATSTKRRSK